MSPARVLIVFPASLYVLETVRPKYACKHCPDGTVVTAKTGVTQDTPAGAMVSGFPSRPHKEWLRATANLFTLDELRRRVKKLEEAVRQLGGKA